MAQFSGAVKIGDLNDFIAPSQACVVSLQKTAPTPQPAQHQAPPPTEGLQLNVRSSRSHSTKQQPQAAAAAENPSSIDEPKQQPAGGFQQTVLSGENQAVKVSLNDCLACSGCVTSAETVLLQAQSLKEFVARCEDPDAIVVVSISPQSRASLAALHGISPEEVHGRVANFLKLHLSVSLVLDIGLGQALALAESAAEFMQRYNRDKHAGRVQAANGSSSSSSSGQNDVVQTDRQLPMLASACPGWVCYAEKTHGAYILPHIASTRSPQGVMGSLVKRVLAPARGWDPSHVYHVTVMPCYDKKLEASRDDFLVPGLSVAEVDSSLTTGELQQLLENFGLGDLKTLPSGRADNLLQLLVTAKQQQQQELPLLSLQEPLMRAQLGGSGGYAAHIFSAAARQLYGVDLTAVVMPAVQQPGSHTTTAANGTAAAAANGSTASAAAGAHGCGLPFKALRNADFQELQLLGPDGQPLLRFALAYGFRNIQTVVRQIKTGRCPYDYVEVMACPSGCLNGGGQLKPPKGTSSAQLLQDLELLYFRQQAAADPAGQQRPDQHQPLQPPQQQQQQQWEYCVQPGAVQLLKQVQSSTSTQLQQEAGRPCPQLTDLQASSGSLNGQLLPAVYDVVLGGQPGSAAAQELLHTQYHKREKTVATTLSDW